MSRPPANDPQRDKIYAMESAEFAGWFEHVLPYKQLRRLALRACRSLRVKPPRIEVLALAVAGEQEAETLRLDCTQGCNGLVLAHELAHYVMYLNSRDKKAPHGPEFVRLYGSLLDAMRLVPWEGFAAACKRHDVRIARKITR